MGSTVLDVGARSDGRLIDVLVNRQVLAPKGKLKGNIQITGLVNKKTLRLYASNTFSRVPVFFLRVWQRLTKA